MSLEENPDPDTRIVVPAIAEAGLSTSEAGIAVPVTVSVAEAESPVDPVAVSV